jgi:hypothetical protein
MSLDVVLDANKYVFMPAGPAGMGFAYFIGTKYVGYSLFSKYGIAKDLEQKDEHGAPPPSPWAVGAVRTVIGVAVGVAVGLAFWKIPHLNSDRLFDNGLFFVLLVPVRIGEWWLLLKSCYPRFKIRGRRTPWLIFAGSVTSFLLDAAGIVLAFVLPGGMWVC